MKQLFWLSSMIFSLILFLNNSQAEDAREVKPRFKGVELYSWKSNDGDWLFVLVDGTNRMKTEKIIKENKNQLKGIKELKKALNFLAKGENVTWGDHGIRGFEYPPEAMRKEIEKAALDAKINLSLRRD